MKKTYNVTCTLIYNGTANVEAESAEEAIEIVREMLNQSSDMPLCGHIGEVEFDFGEVTADYADEEENWEDECTEEEDDYEDADCDEADVEDDCSEPGITVADKEDLEARFCSVVFVEFRDGEEGKYYEGNYRIRYKPTGMLLSETLPLTGYHLYPGSDPALTGEGRWKRAEELIREYLATHQADIIDEYVKSL